MSSDAAAAAAGGLSTDAIGYTSVGVRAGYAHGKTRVTIASRLVSRGCACDPRVSVDTRTVVRMSVGLVINAWR